MGYQEEEECLNKQISLLEKQYLLYISKDKNNIRLSCRCSNEEYLERRYTEIRNLYNKRLCIRRKMRNYIIKDVEITPNFRISNGSKTFNFIRPLIRSFNRAICIN